MFKKIGKNKKILLNSIVCGLIGLSACTDNIQNKHAASEASSISNTISNEKQPLVYDDNVSVSKDAQQLVLTLIKSEIDAGRLRKEDINEEDILKLGKIFTIAMNNATNGGVDSQLLTSLLSENNQSISSDALKNLFINNTHFNVETKTDSEASANLLKLIKQNIPNMKIYEVKEIKNAPSFFTVIIDVQGNKFPIFTNKTADFYFVMDNPELNRYSLLDRNAKVVSLSDDSANPIYKSVVSSIDTTKLIQFKYGNGDRKIYIFTDPDCPFCHQLDKELFAGLNSKDNVTIYYVMNPILSLHPDSHLKAGQILCSANPSQSWKTWQEKRELPNVENFDEKTCVQKVADQSIYAEIMGFDATPTIISGEGKILIGKPDIGLFRKLINNQPLVE